MKWVKIGNGDIRPGDVVRWEQGYFIKRGSKKFGRAVLVGMRVTSMQVNEVTPDGWVIGEVRSCEVGASKVHKREVEKLKVGEPAKRAYKTLIKGKGERLEWPDESLRAVLVSRFLGEREHERWMAMETDEG
jgi:hypothetical protein